MYVLVASDGVLRNLRRGPTANLEQAKNSSEETAQKHICRLPSHYLHFNSSNSNKQYNWLPIVLLLFKQTMTSGTRPPVRNIRRGEEGVRASDLGPSENQATLGPELRKRLLKAKLWGEKMPSDEHLIQGKALKYCRVVLFVRFNLSLT